VDEATVMAVDTEVVVIAAAVIVVDTAVVVMVRRLFGWPPYHEIEFAKDADV
jgi:hypothetical protein